MLLYRFLCKSIDKTRIILYNNNIAQNVHVYPKGNTLEGGCSYAMS